ncbi:DUF1033 family protein [Streptococcus saliviloxodontae]|uniref:DUF1033 family protein n=1 Tax=Streptococcus saliviloxodontae TaxID=1349416 RepID=A0ABS2PMS2_9STRE|nr:DUF1033 family protein [Streptococcus saliviloxodontae]MBM7636727.1 hypothetical protein [Streptococcus saliviloxodontae]
MYQVVSMFGDFEPWWFLEDWKEDIVSVREFENYYDALKYYKQLWQDLRETYPHFDSKSSIMSAFWTEDEQRWCEECDEDLQQYHSILLLTDWQEIPSEWRRPGYSRCNAEGMHSTCSLRR